MGDIEYEIVRLSDYRVGICRGRRLCLDKGEEKCPYEDDRDVLIEKGNAGGKQFPDLSAGVDF